MSELLETARARVPSPVAVPSAALVGAGLVGGYGVARATGVRSLGGVVLAVCGAAAGRTWLASGGPATATNLGILYGASFGLSHPLAKKLGAWPSVLTVAAVNAAASWAAVDRFNFRPDDA
ncbi:hypothetical protein EAE32_04090 [Kocuria tytonicola]|uniref:Uncharacterized protein n=1 Tax=Kocuria tytonicola TaxID=2055946 RepID=A0A3L9L6E1_9MICC|nr:hypothetical protein [Kocuria tytonicola]RLY94380.1 hypothetical protein EAE32_04090 [Kocuria tytonicola]